ncbi:Rho GDP-dissociation inhibitor 1, putative [Cryptococcus deneoformans JEC21]|uniref:Rho GDP-dissociation inhibitor n=1 Tax=Cryptococcus deneoformans (strain JEC21 / ATCC MYA-565) TaxID=214684 RepID=Q5KDV9_CRYD1|nr:Rho GDP-dissociation inhibitor 1, putative [Cryptococcus neoformans var. neoformans JEC21]AAW44709.2 Rho GDP-dissociation inhibitor 1, putative [Cryptococcus neoformans var. neoformans JEC21]
MSNQQPEDELAPTRTEGYKLGHSKTVAELAALDQDDESLQRWKQSLGIAAGASAGGEKRVVLKSLFLSSPTLPSEITIDLTQSKDALAKLKKDPVTIKEGVEYSVGITFMIENEIVSGLKYLQVVKRSGITVDKTEAMLGSYGPQPEPFTKVFASEESPSGMLARSGTYVVRSRVIDDDNTIWLDFEWGFKLGKEW